MVRLSPTKLLNSRDKMLDRLELSSNNFTESLKTVKREYGENIFDISDIAQKFLKEQYIDT